MEQKETKERHETQELYNELRAIGHGPEADYSLGFLAKYTVSYANRKTLSLQQEIEELIKVIEASKDIINTSLEVNEGLKAQIEELRKEKCCLKEQEKQEAQYKELFGNIVKPESTKVSDLQIANLATDNMPPKGWNSNDYDAGYYNGQYNGMKTIRNIYESQLEAKDKEIEELKAQIFRMYKEDENLTAKWQYEKERREAAEFFVHKSVYPADKYKYWQSLVAKKPEVYKK